MEVRKEVDNWRWIKVRRTRGREREVQKMARD